MNKAILVIDMPDNCYECVMCRENHYGDDVCIATYERIFTAEKPDWCPLKPAPEYCVYFGGDDDYADGYNDCLSEIIGE